MLNCRPQHQSERGVPLVWVFRASSLDPSPYLRELRGSGNLPKAGRFNRRERRGRRGFNSHKKHKKAQKGGLGRGYFRAMRKTAPAAPRPWWSPIPPTFDFGAARRIGSYIPRTAKLSTGGRSSAEPLRETCAYILRSEDRARATPAATMSQTLRAGSGRCTFPPPGTAGALVRHSS